MRAKFEVRAVTQPYEGAEALHLSAVSEKPYDPDGKSEDNDFARWTPDGELTMTVTNPALHGTIKVGEKYYLDFTKAE